MVATSGETISASLLHELGNVPVSYVHEWRVVTPQEPLVLSDAIFKWYHVHRQGVTIPLAIDAEARNAVEEALAGPWDASYGLNFAILHLSTTAAYLLAGVWRGHQELWLRVYARGLAPEDTFQRIDTSGEDAPAGCVWELAATCHERMAWHRYLFSERTERDKRAWLGDVYSGPA